MQVADKPKNETERLQALIELDLLDSDQEDQFDDIALNAKDIFKTPIALISLIDSDRQWFKARAGLDVAETPRDAAFCAHAILDRETMAVENALQDERFCENPLVLGGPKIRSYLGAPLISRSDHALGTLCVIDTQPRNWSQADRKILAGLARSTANQIEQRCALQKMASASQEISGLTRDLQAHRSFLEQVSEVANVGGWMLDLETSELIWTRQTREIHEVADDFQPILEEAINFYAPEARSVIERAVERGTNDGEAWDLELPLITAKGRKIWVRAVGRCEFCNNKPVQLVGAFQDVTLRRTERDALSDALATADRALSDLSAYQTALDEHSIVAMTDGAGEILFANDRFCEISGYDRQELIGQNHRLINSGEHPKSFFVDMWRTISRGESWHGEIRNRAKDGSLYWVDTTIVPLIGADGRPDRYVSVRYDITQRVEQQAMLAQQREAAEAATHAKSQFLANMSHEIRTPLNGVVALAGALENTPLSSKQREMAALIKASGTSLATILSDVLDLSKIEAGKLTIREEAFNLKAAVRAAVDVLHVSAREKGLDLRTDYRGDAGEAFAGDETRMQQIVSNLVSNAVKFTDAGRVIVDVHAKIDETDSDRAHIIISVEDTGIGLTDEEQSQVFERFEQADGSMSRKRGGVGLGLWICKSLCDAMGGAISVTSKHGVGSVFTVELRLAYAASNRTICPGYGTRAENHASEYRTKILLAEDHLVNQRVFAIILEAAGFDLTIADNGVEAVELAIEDQYDMILMDLQMPKKDGLTAIAEIRAAERRSGRYTPIAALSANAMQEHVDAAFAAGADGHIAKPVTPEGLIAALRALPPKAGDTYQKIATG